MLTLLSIETPRDHVEVLKSFDPQTATWLVSDLKSKLDLNRQLLKERSFVPGDAVLRVSELWRKLLSRLRPDLQIVSREFALTLIGHKLKLSGLDWVRGPGAAQTTLDYMTQLMPVLSHPEGRALMRDFFEARPEAHARWGRWYDLSNDLWNQFMNDGFIAAPWASGVLVNEPSLTEVWTRPLVVDLGAELSSVEADLLIQFSGSFDITVLKPDPPWRAEYPKTLLAYDLFKQKLNVQHTRAAGTAASSLHAANKDYRKYTTMIAEVKAAVAECRKWLDSGLPAEQIAIVAGDIESYWPALASYLDEEGIPSQKDHVRRLHAFPDVARFLANLRLKAGAFSESDVELGLFGSNTEASGLITYDRFKTVYKNLYAREDLDREVAVRSRFEIDISTRSEMTRDDFVAWSLRQLPGEMALDRVETLFKPFFAEIPMSVRFDVDRWVGYMESLAQRVECHVRDGVADGIGILKFGSADTSPATKMMILGLTETCLKTSAGTSILLGDVSSLSERFGFHLPHDDQARLEFEVRWLTEDASRELILSVPETDFNGGAQAPAWLWIKGSRESDVHDDLTVPEATRWDEIQKSSITEIARLRRWSAEQAQLTERAFREDLGEVPYEPFGAGLVTAVSPSGIEDYLNCPFVFAAKRLMGLSDSPEIDLQVDASRRGNLIHKLFELLTVEPMRFDLSDEELQEVVEKARAESRLELADVRLWPPLKARHVEFAKRFLAFEKESRSQFPYSKVLDREVDIAGYIRPETGELIPNEEPGTIKFIGRIDRVDTDHLGNLAIYDYKSTASTTAQYGAWCRNNRIQLLLYALAVEKGLTKFPAAPVQSALYYVARPLARDQGFKVTDTEQGLFAASDRKQNKLSTEKKNELYREGQALLKKAVEGIRAGRFAPNPGDRKDCSTCQWSAVCRAPHLTT